MIHINSSNRIKQDKYVIDNTFLLENNPLKIKDNLLYIKIVEGIPKQINKILLSGIEENIVYLKLFTKYNNTFATPLQFINKYLRIEINPSIYNIDELNNPIYVEISGFINNIGNIHKKELNRTHNILFNIPGHNNNNYNSFYIELSKDFIGNFEYDDMFLYNIKLKFKHFGGISINNFELIKEVYSIDNNNIMIKLPYNGYYNECFGGSNVILSIVGDIIKGYPNPSNYFIDFEKNYNIKSIEFIGAIFPNPCNVLNKIIKWEYIDDDTIYSLEITSGYYEKKDFENYINNTIKNIIKKDLTVIINNDVIFKSNTQFRLIIDDNITNFSNVIKYPNFISNNQYFFMSINGLDNIETTGKNKIFAKIINNTTIIPSKIEFESNINLSGINISFIDENNSFIDFQNQDHSYIIKLHSS